MPRPALPHQNRSRIHKLSAKSLDSQPLSMRIPPVRRRPAALLMCHDSFPLLYSCVTQANRAEPVAQVRFVDLRLFSRRSPQPCHSEWSDSAFSCARPPGKESGTCAGSRGEESLFASPPRLQLLQLNIANLHGRKILPVPARNLVLIALLELQHRQFLRPPLAHNLASYSHFQRIRSQHDFLVVGMHRKHGAERHLLAHFSANPLNPYSVAGRDAILLPPGLNNGVHLSSKR